MVSSTPNYPANSITCFAVDRRTGRKAVGMPVTLRRSCPGFHHLKWHGTTNSNGLVLFWESEDSSCDDLRIHLLKNLDQTTCWHMRFHTGNYFAPVSPEYSAADVLFTIRQGDEMPTISLYADIRGFGAWIAPLKSIYSPIKRQRFSKLQNQALWSHFVDEPYPEPEAYEKLSGILNLRVQSTRKWFERRRYLQKRALRQQYMQTVSEEASEQPKGLPMSSEQSSEITRESDTQLHALAVVAEDHDMVQENSTAGVEINPSVSEIQAQDANIERKVDIEVEVPMEETSQVGAIGIEMQGLRLVHDGERIVRRSTRRMAEQH